VSAAEVFQVAATVLVALGGGGAIIAGMSSWLGKLWADRLLERERVTNEGVLEAYKRELELSFNARNRVSEAEFEIYRQLWTEVTQVSFWGLGIRSGLTKSSLSEEEHVTRYREFQQALRQFEVSYQSHRPFYAPKVHEAIEHLAICVSIENKRAVANRDLDGIALGQSHMEGVIPIVEAREAVCQAIRERLYPVQIAPTGVARTSAAASSADDR
jgi:hypothetical protein